MSTAKPCACGDARPTGVISQSSREPVNPQELWRVHVQDLWGSSNRKELTEDLGSSEEGQVVRSGREEGCRQHWGQ